MEQKAVFFSFLGDQVCTLAVMLKNCGFLLLVVNCEDTHSCLVAQRIEHTYITAEETGTYLDKLLDEMTSELVTNTVLVIDCSASLSSNGFDANMQLR